MFFHAWLRSEALALSRASGMIAALSHSDTAPTIRAATKARGGPASTDGPVSRQFTKSALLNPLSPLHPGRYSATPPQPIGTQRTDEGLRQAPRYNRSQPAFDCPSPSPEPRCVEEVTVCPICQSPRRSAFATVRDAGEDVAYQLCLRCGHVYQSPRMSPDEMEAFYSSGYRLIKQGTEEPTEKDLLTQTARALGAIRMIAGQLPSASRHLDLGSSSGALLEAFRDRFQCQGVGIEPGESYRHYSLARGLRVFPDLADLIEAAEAPFDLVTAMHVLEHLPDPSATLAQLRIRHMHPGAFLLVEVPNLAEHQCLELAHLHAFTISSLKDAVKRAGFQIEWVRCHGSFRSPILRLYVTLLARVVDKPSVSKYLPFAAYRTRVSRRIGVAKREFFTRLYPDWTWQSPRKALERWAATGRIR